MANKLFWKIRIYYLFSEIAILRTFSSSKITGIVSLQGYAFLPIQEEEAEVSACKSTVLIALSFVKMMQC